MIADSPVYNPKGSRVSEHSLYPLPVAMPSGQTLVEVVVAIGMVVLLVTGLIVGTTVSLKGGQFGRTKSGAISFAQEAIELARGLRDVGWTSFRARSGMYCLSQNNTFPQEAVGSSNECTGNVVSPTAIYTRWVTFAWDEAATPPRMNVTATVTWNEGSTTHTSALSTFFTQWK